MATSVPVVEKVTRTRTIPPAELEKERTGRTTPDFWDFIESMTDEMWAGDYMLYILREDPKPSTYGGSNTLEKCPGYMIMPNGVRLKLDSREDVELAIKEKWGGKAFRLILKKGRERLTEGKCMNDAPPKYPDTAQQFTHPLPNAQPAGSSDNVAVKAMEITANQNPQLINIAIDAVKSAADIISRHNQPATAPAATTDSELDRAFKAAMIQRMTQDPIEMYIKLKSVLEPAKSQDPLVEKILTTALDKLLNPAAPVTGRTTLLDLGREFIPVLGTTVKETMHEYRLSREADARIMELQRSMNPQPAPTVTAAPHVIDVAPGPSPAPAPPAANSNPAPAPEAPATPALTFPQIEAHLAKIIKNVEYPVDEAVDRVLEFLYDTDPRIVGALLNPPSIDARLAAGKQGLLQLFQYEPALQQCMTNLPRLSEFLDKFIVAATEAEAVEANLRAAAPANAAARPTAPTPSV